MIRSSAGWALRNTHPAVLAVRELLPEWARTTATCPHCPVDGTLATVLEHMLRDHDSEVQGAAAWLETVDPDLFALAVHYLISGAYEATPPNTRCC
ncbi:MAG: hypothetical protein AB1679_03945 [Actinomycetota bacterium]|jgi:hypothetical protein